MRAVGLGSVDLREGWVFPVGARGTGAEESIWPRTIGQDLGYRDRYTQ